MRHRFRPVRFPSVLLPVLFSFCAAEARAQTSQDADRAQLSRSQTESPFGPRISPEGIVGDHAAPSPNDADLGEQEILKREERYQPFTASVALPMYWTSNVALVRSGEKSDFLEAPVAGIYYEPRITRTLYGLVDVREQLFYYDKYDTFNFGAFDVDVGLSCVVP